MFHRIVFLGLFLAVVGVPAQENSRHAQFYAYYTNAATNLGGAQARHGGVGLDYVLYKGLGAGIEIGGIGFSKTFADFGVLSLNGSYHFRRTGTHRGLDPFVTGGYTSAFDEGSVSMINLGAGVNYWFWRHLGVRADFRGYVWPGGPRYKTFWGVRFGLAF